MRYSKIFDATTAITLEDGANLELVNSEFIGCDTAVKSNGQANITEFRGNTFNGGIGVDITDSQNTNLDAGSFDQSNSFIGCIEGIKLSDRSSALIRFNEFINCGIGVLSSGSSPTVKFNTMDQCNIGCHIIGGSAEIELNDIGYTVTGIILNSCLLYTSPSPRD